MSLSTISLIELDPERVSEATGAKTAAFFCHRLPVRVDRAVIEELKLISNQRGKVNVRICLHEDPSANHHDMIARGYLDDLPQLNIYNIKKHGCLDLDIQ